VGARNVYRTDKNNKIWPENVKRLFGRCNRRWKDNIKVTEQDGVAVTLKSCIREVLSSVDQDTDYPVQVFCGFSQYLHETAGILT
jgi:hypothetical protein